MKKNIFIVILVLIILGLGGYLVYDKVIDKNEKENKTESKVENKKEYTYKDLAGNYYFETEVEMYDSKLISKHYLVLEENGTFNYKQSLDIRVGMLGNYIINGNKIILNCLFLDDNGSGVSLSNQGLIELTIDDNNTLISKSNKLTMLGPDNNIEYSFKKTNNDFEVMGFYETLDSQDVGTTGVSEELSKSN